jgi:hypothetical protein
MSVLPTSPWRRLLHIAGCYLLILTLCNPAGPIIALALMFGPRFAVGMTICYLLLVLSLAAWIHYAWLREVAWSFGLRVLAYSCLALSAGTLYLYLGFANKKIIAAAALLLGVFVLLGIWRLKLWVRPEDLYSVWG